MDGATSDSVMLQEDLVEDLRAQRPAHPALSRVHDRLVGAQSMPITSYDRMHHRHNRS